MTTNHVQPDDVYTKICQKEVKRLENIAKDYKTKNWLELCSIQENNNCINFTMVNIDVNS